MYIFLHSKPGNLRDVLYHMDTKKAFSIEIGKSSISELDIHVENEEKAILKKYNKIIDDVRNFDVHKEKVSSQNLIDEGEVIENDNNATPFEKRLISLAEHLLELKKVLSNLRVIDLSSVDSDIEDLIEDLIDKAEDTFSVKLRVLEERLKILDPATETETKQLRILEDHLVALRAES